MTAETVSTKNLRSRTARASSLLRLALLACLALGLVIAAEAYFASRRENADRLANTIRRPAFGPRTYAAALADSTARIAAKRELSEMFPGDWLRSEALAQAYSDRFRLTGDYADLAQASKVIALGRAQADAPAGPILADAQIAMTGHRVAAAEAALEDFMRSVALEPEERAAAAALAGDIAFYRGDMAGTKQRYAAAKAIEPGGLVLRAAIVDKAEGNFDKAITDLRASLTERRRPSPFAIATLALQMGAVELARGNSGPARAMFERANIILPGYWLTEAHLAQADAIDGHAEKAITAMQRVAVKSGSAEAMDALAMLLRSDGKSAESRTWAARAEAAWRRRIKLAPAAAYGHAVEHEIVFGRPERALELARRNLANRPFGESRLLLAHTLVVAGRVDEALEQLEQAEKGGWRSAPLYALRAELLALAGRNREAEAARDAAEALNPHIFDPQTALVWFSHG